ncbi:hypothetical protein EX30DRAFT_342061 [Ascodesmis nigricans]|uniref:Uncharacterized protein n=1 Tax=Ascodesmis nigricans TaxID=341454 RepID=A0A4V3SID6_9PEZI|nr:hypothetical protein EX30DRAFT_342061 [Ascodesmis nigricans]
MGALCGKESASNDDNLPAGRVLGSAPPNTGGINAGAGATSRISSRQKKPKVGGPARTLGGSGSGDGGTSSSSGGGPEDPRAAAARAAELRNAQNRTGSGSLSRQLDEQKRKTREQHLQDASRDALNERNKPPVWD